MQEFLRRQTPETRRRFISRAAKSLLGTSLLTHPLNGSAIAATGRRKPTARNVIYLYMGGGLSQLDSFDPKPEAAPEVRGNTDAIQTNADGVIISEYFPQLAQQMDKATLVRSVNSTQGAHEQGDYYMRTSYTLRGTIRHPQLGAWMLKHEGRTNRTLPGAVTINSAGGGAGFLESKYAALGIGDPGDGLKNSTRPEHLSQVEFEDRLKLCDAFDTAFHNRYNQKHVRAYNDMYDDAVRLMKSEDLKAFDLDSEAEGIRDAYGRNSFGQGCLLARRLIEHDVRFVEVKLSGWDNHNNIYSGFDNRCNKLDQGLATLLADLERRGLLEETIVAVTTEFGRTPVLNINDGRDHFPRAFSCLLAGGGIPGGRAYGKTDENGSEVIEDKISIPNFNATIAYALGLPLDKVIYSPSKRPFTVADNGQPALDLLG